MFIRYSYRKVVYFALVAAGMQDRKERMNRLAVSVAAKWSLRNEAAKRIGVNGKNSRSIHARKTD